MSHFIMVGLILAAAIAAAEKAQAYINYPWCINGDARGIDCSYRSKGVRSFRAGVRQSMPGKSNLQSRIAVRGRTRPSPATRARAGPGQRAPALRHRGVGLVHGNQRQHRAGV
jgi:hypothetical protein